MLQHLIRALLVLTALASVGAAAARADETTAETFDRGPFWFRSVTAEGDHVTGLRPFWDAVRDDEGQLISASVLYPLWHREVAPAAEVSRWSFFNLINYERNDATGTTRFDAWPFYFSRQTDTDSSDDYRAVFPIYGDVPQRFGQDRLNWVFFPLYGRFEKNGAVTTTTPWPFIKTITGEGHRGFEVWPLGGHRESTMHESAESFALWPLYYRKRTGPADNPTSLQTGFLPLYALDRSPGYRSETYLWPFFGYVDRTEPYQYHARHYFWPLWVQGRGDDRYVNRWAPFYSHSIRRGYDKTWVMWPLWRQATWHDANLQHERRQFLYFLYHSTVQTSLHNPDAAPARKTHLWPFFSSWDNGAGRKQVQAFSPVEVFFPHNERVRRLWTPLFNVYRYNRDDSEDVVEHSVLWNLIKWSRRPGERAHRVSLLGPLLRLRTAPGEKSFTLFGDQLGLEYDDGLRARTPFTSSSSTASP
ncbi:hypothetical protein [Actomonas aquatica]|uniref:Uncharacterized protein n=1 Tax=Actomonas aquatica TaxID=2866162 RepID=A0ABZ1CEB8_9BACT|nr:hypothetical protein [Opitutus sp. WL0086]WRQ89762.1 hypothetical protein K1X11_010125 [Opitutus sp. WL0086]